MNARAYNQPLLTVDADRCQPASWGVNLRNIDPDLMVSLGRHLREGGPPQSLLRVSVVRTGASIGEDLPDVFGRYHFLEDGVRFVPHFPFERGLSYRASFDPRPLGRPELSDVLTLEFSLPKEHSALPTEVKHIFPSSDRLPENLLRFYVCFSNSMQRGRVRAEISLLGPDGEPAPDTLYRAPALAIIFPKPLDWALLRHAITIAHEGGPPVPGQVAIDQDERQWSFAPMSPWVAGSYSVRIASGLEDVCGNGLLAAFDRPLRSASDLTIETSDCPISFHLSY